ncbi:MAG: Fe-S cluster assembly protein NifU [Synechococcaceae cyanobacterium SM2_3_1]|nr:Fe-S cluster assembly protein NifU [Synechococcaceae cyanobacterium SM2_3_1]
MWDYSEKVLELFYNPKNQGVIEDQQEAGIQVVTGDVGSITCGDALRLHLKIDVAADRILDASFQTFGCTSAIASSSALTELLKGLTLDEALKISNREIAAYLGGLPEAKMHCSVMGQEALEAAIYKYRGLALEIHDEDESALLCTCFSISESKIRRTIRENGLTEAEQVTNYIKAGGGCGSCLAQIDDLIAEVRAEMQQEQPNSARDSADAIQTSVQKISGALTNLQKITLIQQVIEEEIRPVLMADGGDVELYDVEGDQVKVQLKGACGSCSSSTDTLKVAIEARLQDRVLPSLVVEAV